LINFRLIFTNFPFYNVWWSYFIVSSNSSLLVPSWISNLSSGLPTLKILLKVLRKSIWIKRLTKFAHKGWRHVHIVHICSILLGSHRAASPLVLPNLIVIYNLSMVCSIPFIKFSFFSFISQFNFTMENSSHLLRIILVNAFSFATRCSNFIKRLPYSCGLWSLELFSASGRVKNNFSLSWSVCVFDSSDIALFTFVARRNGPWNTWFCPSLWFWWFVLYFLLSCIWSNISSSSFLDCVYVALDWCNHGTAHALIDED